MATTLADHIALSKVGIQYVSSHKPQRMGNAAPIAYGGYDIGLGIHAAYKTAPAGFHLYSAMGHYLRAVSTDAHLICTPTELRSTRNFVTYRVLVEQKAQSSDKPRLCMELLVDFHKDEPSLLNYSTQPTQSYTHWQNCLPWDSVVEDHWRKAGKIAEEDFKTFNTLFGLPRNLYESRPCPEGITGQNLMGMVKTTQTTQDHLSPTAKTSADWFRAKHPLPTEGEHIASLGFIMDGLLSFLPLTHNHMFFDDADACSSLDFAFRVFSPNPKVDEWHLREVVSHRAGYGRTYSESRVWDERGVLVACMTQQSILRVPGSAKI
ncbi:acyl-CoA thioesterase II [Aspergillus sclerotioniger CBS 115572]|uniref:Acyl-CoA thioesterase II n=1 Tax=Aspergillus sclerotioniger CBS 115572 TaxID=1450535 RepID=A0A317V2P9_9EURO|nr:acyl-CoA thioesterase II [Aspergillus sclerotioniger CBS 115572]PWY66470.1 acyl-CoA thioesterase II [Aspergillus sclerotioniger CBS 115572]